ncbi:MAG: DUF5403 family protein [Microbacterium ginsengisoli]|jgi:hypothetical protein|nr:DUF5403 family protein [Microbacterium ginsengisoli]
MAEVYANAGIIAAQLAGDSIEMDRIAEDLASRTRANAAERGDADYAASVRVTRARGRNGVTDRLVEATDPLAAPKELGHVVRNSPDGPVLGYVRGMRYMSRAVTETPEVRGD